jgi:hypothetical protein
MLLINLRQALRNLRRNKTYTFINLIGLGLACSFVILVLLFVFHEVSIDKFHANGPHLYQLEMTNLFDIGDTSEHPGVENPFLFAANGRQKTSLLRGELQQYVASQPDMTDMTGASFKYAGSMNSNGHIINGKREYLTEMTVDYNYFEFNKIPIISGRAFSPAFATNRSLGRVPRIALYLNLNKGTLVMIGVSVIIALPIARWIATNWLRGFAYRIELGLGIYTLSTLLAVLCALLAVSYHTLRTAMANPIDSLRTE